MLFSSKVICKRKANSQTEADSIGHSVTPSVMVGAKNRTEADSIAPSVAPWVVVGPKNNQQNQARLDYITTMNKTRWWASPFN